MEKISEKHRLFVEEYLNNGLNGTQAYLTVYKSVKKEETARVNASRLLTNANVKALLEEKQAKTIKKLEITREDILRRLNSRSLLMEEIQILASKETLTEAEEERLQRLSFVIKASDANKSDEMIAKMLGFNEPDKLDVNIKEFKANFGT